MWFYVVSCNTRLLCWNTCEIVVQMSPLFNAFNEDCIGWIGVCVKRCRGSDGRIVPHVFRSKATSANVSPNSQNFVIVIVFPNSVDIF